MPSDSEQQVQDARAFERLPVRNASERTLTLILEPWAEEFDMPPGTCYIVEGEGPSAYAPFTLEYVDDLIIVGAWDGSDARILGANGEVIADWTGIRVPIFAAPPEAPSGDDA